MHLNKSTKEILEKGDELTLIKLLEAARIGNATEVQAHNMEGKSGTKVNPMQTKKKRFARPNKEEENEIECFRCGKKGHYASNRECPAPSTKLKCVKCDKTGYDKIQCKTRMQRQKYNVN